MIKTKYSMIPVLFATALSMSLLVASCTTEKDTPQSNGAIKLPLSAVGSQGSSFRLMDGIFLITDSGGTSLTIHSNDYLNQVSAEMDLTPGSYSVQLLDGWTMGKWVDSEYIPVEAELTSENPTTVEISESHITVTRFSFVSGDEIISEDTGTLVVVIEVEEPAECDSDKTDCAGVCVDLNDDEDHCGVCGHVCAEGGLCLDGTCTGETCTSPEELCAGECIDVTSDNQNCGSCGMVCAGETTCVDGTCEEVCAEDETLCDSSCVDTASDDANCGACDNVCGDDESCVNGACMEEVACEGDRRSCDGTCVDLVWDNNNCGECGNVCPSNGWCNNSECVCANTDIVCDGACINQLWDNNNCGACGNVCSTWCNNGICA